MDKNTAQALKSAGTGLLGGVQEVGSLFGNGAQSANLNNSAFNNAFNSASSYEEALNNLSSNSNYFSDLKFTKTDDNQREFYNTALSNLFNSQEAQKNRDFQKEMSSTQYQRAVKDLEAAGINPLAMLSSGSLSPASSPSGSSASAAGIARSHDGTSDILHAVSLVANTAVAGGKMALAVKQFQAGLDAMPAKQAHELSKMVLNARLKNNINRLSHNRKFSKYYHLGDDWDF